MSAASVRAEAKRLLALSLEGGAVSSRPRGRRAAALAKSRPAHTLRPLLRAYLANVRRELTRGEARIEHAGPLSTWPTPGAPSPRISPGPLGPRRPPGRPPQRRRLLGGFRGARSATTSPTSRPRSAWRPSPSPFRDLSATLTRFT
jgi:hypothetical protein